MGETVDSGHLTNDSIVVLGFLSTVVVLFIF